MIGKTSDGVLRRFSEDFYVVPAAGLEHEVDAVDDPFAFACHPLWIVPLEALDNIGGVLQEMALKLVCKSKAVLLEKMHESMGYITLEDGDIFASSI
ncbi:hypothetical protein BGX28_003963 [Mortierella sp. GBA30]|nr:hypothetical protein BGX28_003963 [Mortierella sp. GBA30]